MALLRQQVSGELLALHSHHTIGRRSDQVDTLIAQDDVSKIHAVIEWNGNHWQIRCLSTNGTWLDNTRLDRDVETPLKQGQTINLSEPNGIGWVIEDISAPKDLLLPLNEHTSLIELENYHLLPNEETPAASCYFCTERDAWVIDNNGKEDAHTLSHGQPYTIGAHQWQLFVADRYNPTRLSSTLNNTVNDFHWVFDVSNDEESIKLDLEQHGKTVHLGERSHYYLLLQLARHKAEHLQSGLPEEAAGWVTKALLERELGLTESHLNIQLHRACKQLADYFSFTIDKPDSIQRRRGQLKLTTSSFTIIKGGERTHHIEPHT